MNQAILIFTTMGNQQPKAENTGTVLNEIDIQPTSVQNNDIIICIYIITAILTIQFVYKAYKAYHKMLRKRYTESVIQLYRKNARGERKLSV